MSNGRKKAIEKEVSETKKRGYSNYLYVDLDKLDNLGIEQFKPAEGDNFLCILPPRNESVFFAKKVFVHYNVGVDNTMYLCTKKMYDKPCPVCEAAYKLMKEDKDDEQIAELRHSERYLFFVVDMSSKKTMNKGVQWYDAPKMVKDGICSISQNKRTKEIIDVSDPEEERNICFVKTGSKLRTRYDGFELEKREYEFNKEWLDVPSFDEVLQKVEYDVIKADLLGFSPEEEEQPRKRKEELDEDEKPKERKSRDEDEDENEDESLRSRLRKRIRKETED